MSENLVNDVKRLERISDELSGTNQKLLAAVCRITELIIRAVPPDMRDRDLGMNYRVITKNWCLDTFSRPHLVKSRFWFRGSLEFGEYTPSLLAAHQFATDVTKGLLRQICSKLDQYSAVSAHELNALEQGEVLLKKNISQ